MLQRSRPGRPDPTTATVTHAGTLILRSGQKLPIQYEIIDGKPRWLGDIDLKPAGGGEMHLDGFTLDAGGPSTGTFASGQLWKNNMVYYRFDSTIADPTTILAGMMDWMSKTQVSFLYDNDKTASDYILFRSDTSGCHSGEGHRTGENDIYLQQGACFADQAVHEIGHTMGLLHEQSRPDRDNYITIQWSNICQGAASGGGCASFNQASNFQIVNTGIDVGSFDFSSIMLYPAITGDPHFAVDTSKPIITKTDGTTYPTPTGGLSGADQLAVQSLYGSNSVTFADWFYISPGAAPMQVVQGGQGQANVVMNGPWVHNDSGAGASTAIVSCNIPGVTASISPGYAFSGGEGVASLSLSASLSATPGNYTCVVSATDGYSHVKHYTMVSVQVDACAPSSFSSVCSGLVTPLCGSHGAGCGVSYDCGSCASGDTCSSGFCCASGESWVAADNACEVPGSGGKTCSPPPRGCGRGRYWDDQWCVCVGIN